MLDEQSEKNDPENQRILDRKLNEPQIISDFFLTLFFHS